MSKITNISEAAKQAINLGKQLKSVIEVGEFLGEVGGLQQVATEAKQQAEKAVKQRDQNVEELLQVQKQLQEAVVSRDTLLKECTQAKKTAIELQTVSVYNAQATAQNIKEEAKTFAQSVIDAANISVKKLEKNREALHSEVQELENKLRNLREGMDRLRGRLD